MAPTKDVLSNAFLQYNILREEYHMAKVCLQYYSYWTLMKCCPNKLQIMLNNAIYPGKLEYNFALKPTETFLR